MPPPAASFATRKSGRSLIGRSAISGDPAWLHAFRTPATRRDRPISWAVAVASFVSIFFSMGLSFGSIGAMTLAFSDKFAGRASEDDISWIGGIRLCFVFLTGILSSILVNRFGARTMQALGCAIAALAVGLSTLATELWHLYLAFGAVAGAGLSLVFTASSVIVEGHFERYLHIALPLSQLGDTVGYSVFPVLTQALLNRIELRNTLLTFCALTAVPLLLSIFYIPAVGKADDEQKRKPNPSAPPQVQDTDADKPCSEAREKLVTAPAAQSLALEHTPLRIAYRQSAQQEDGAVNPRCCVTADAGGDRNFGLIMGHLPSNGLPAVYDANMGVTAALTVKTLEICGGSPIAGCGAMAKEQGGFLNQEHVFYSNTSSSYDAIATDVNRLSRNGLGIDDSKTTSVACTANMTVADRPASAGDQGCSCSSSCGSIGASKSLSQWERLRHLLTRGEVWLLLINMFGWQYASASIFVLLPSYVTRSGEIDKDQAAIGLTLVGVANVVGNVVTVLAALRSYNHTLLFAVSCLLFGVGVMLYTLTATSVAAYYALSSVNGFWLGILLGLAMSVIFDFADDGGLTDLFGLVTFFCGLGGLAGPGITGIIQARVSDAVGLYVSGAASLLACAVLVAPALRRRSSASKEQSPIAA